MVKHLMKLDRSFTIASSFFFKCLFCPGCHGGFFSWFRILGRFLRLQSLEIRLCLSDQMFHSFICDRYWPALGTPQWRMILMSRDIFGSKRSRRRHCVHFLLSRRMCVSISPRFWLYSLEFAGPLCRCLWTRPILTAGYFPALNGASHLSSHVCTETRALAGETTLVSHATATGQGHLCVLRSPVPSKGCSRSGDRFTCSCRWRYETHSEWSL